MEYHSSTDHSFYGTMEPISAVIQGDKFWNFEKKFNFSVMGIRTYIHKRVYMYIYSLCVRMFFFLANDQYYALYI